MPREVLTSESSNHERNLGEQPILQLLAQHQLKPKNLVAASDEQITFKMITRATKGRRLTANTMGKLLRALNAATGKKYDLTDLFNYSP